MTKRIWMAVFAATVLATPAFAQDKRVEVDVDLGWTFSDGVDGSPIPAGGEIYDRLDPKDSFKWGAGLGVLVGPNGEAGFRYGQQMSTLTGGGTTTTEIGDMTINTYHGYFAYNFGDSDIVARPYFLFGLGATNYSSVDYTRRATGQKATLPGGTQFSTTWGAGVKIFPNPGFGVKLGVQWTPTYIKSDSAGWWCDPWYGCYVVGNAKYANQWDITGGLAFRF